jgi:hypothetical protein
MTSTPGTKLLLVRKWGTALKIVVHEIERLQFTFE